MREQDPCLSAVGIGTNMSVLNNPVNRARNGGRERLDCYDHKRWTWNQSGTPAKPHRQHQLPESTGDTTRERLDGTRVIKAYDAKRPDANL